MSFHCFYSVYSSCCWFPCHSCHVCRPSPLISKQRHQEVLMSHGTWRPLLETESDTYSFLRHFKMLSFRLHVTKICSGQRNWKGDKNILTPLFPSSFLFMSQMICDLVNSCQEIFSCHVSWKKILVLDSEQNTYRHLKRNVSFCRLFFLSLIFVVEDFSSSFTLNVLSL